MQWFICSAFTTGDHFVLVPVCNALLWLFLQSNSKHISQEALRVEVLLYAVVAHQTFALRLGNWFQKIVGYSGKSVKVSALAHLISVVWSLLLFKKRISHQDFFISIMFN